MNTATRVSFYLSLLWSVLILVFCTISLTAPWYTEGTWSEGPLAQLSFTAQTHPFYWVYDCEGNGCVALNVAGKEPNGHYSWYDVCRDCDSQLTLYVVCWVMVFCASIAIVLAFLLKCAMFWAHSRGYPASSTCLTITLPALWLVALGLLVTATFVFPVALPGAKQEDKSGCQRFLDALPANTEHKSPCKSFAGDVSWSVANGAKQGNSWWSPATGYIFLVLASALSLLAGAMIIRLVRQLRQASVDEPNYDYSSVGMEMENCAPSGFIAPGL